MMTRDKITIYDISRRLNISAATVSRALNDLPQISLKTRKLVARTAAEMNYKQNRLAQALKSGKTHNIGVVVPYINRNFFSSVIRGIEEEITPHGYHVIICQSHEEEFNEVKQINALLNTQIDGIFISVSKTTKNLDHFRKVLEEKIPLIFFDRTIELPGVSSIVLDDYKAGYKATEHLIVQGCKKIAHLSGESNLQIYKYRFEGYKAALEKYGIKYSPEYVIKTNSKVESGIKAVAQLWDLEVKPDGIFAAGDFVALGAIQELKNKKIKVPDEVCIVSFSNEPFTKHMELSMSSIDQNPQLMGKIAAQAFLEQVEIGNNMNLEKKLVLPPKLFVRNSSRRISNVSII